MAQLPINPNLLVVPDFALEEHAPTRQPLLDMGLTVEQAVATLANIWTVGNNTDKQRWQERTEAEAQAARDRERAAEEAANQQREIARQDEEQARKDDAKKYRDKYVFIPDRPTPSGALVLAAPYASRRLEKGQYVEMYYYTNRGLNAAEAAVTQVDDDALAMKTNSDGSTSWVPAASLRSDKAVIPDKELSWEQFREAVPRLLGAMEQAKWDAARVSMLAHFFGKLQNHPFRQHSRNPLDIRALLTYQGEQRQRWHLAITTATGAWNLSEINETILSETRDRVYRDQREVKDAEHDVSPESPLVSHQCTDPDLPLLSSSLLSSSRFPARYTCYCHMLPLPLHATATATCYTLPLPLHATATATATRYRCPFPQARINAALAPFEAASARGASTPRRGDPSTTNGAAVRTKSTKATNAPYPDRKPSFQGGASSSVFTACAICLGRHQHPVFFCEAKKTWDNCFDTVAKRVDKKLVLNDGRTFLCSDWQRPSGCNSHVHDARHLCSGCAKADHGAQQCPRAQRA
ncbi:hypothetical protein EVJ58_g1654 [Rhodofomes roseus]|uniref:Uncharacterized protein n=1 Tax=Rhodofomes roseus TaxID=34475 RepID=A0A4Y9YXP3_9APHY|nr:hypothetical protein EVJ58_g1654 [Rhodofomes roseus]